MRFLSRRAFLVYSSVSSRDNIVRFVFYSFTIGPMGLLPSISNFVQVSISFSDFSNIAARNISISQFSFSDFSNRTIGVCGKAHILGVYDFRDIYWSTTRERFEYFITRSKRITRSYAKPNGLASMLFGGFKFFTSPIGRFSVRRRTVHV